MDIFDHRRCDEVGQLVEECAREGLSRRKFLERAVALGLTAGSATSLLAACGVENSSTGTSPAASVEVLNVWSAEEQASFSAVVAPFTNTTQIAVNSESTRDLDAVLTTRILADNPPDIAILPNPGKMQQLASKNALIRLDTFLDMSQIRRNYASAWIDLGSYNNGFYALFYKATNKGTVWYNPIRFRNINSHIPFSWSDLIALSDTIAKSGKYPWSMGVESGAASGWPAADWIAEIYLKQSGPTMYDQWVAHKIPWTDASIKSAFQLFGQIAGGRGYITGAPRSILATGFQQASYEPFASPPQAYLYYLGDFTPGFITSQFPHAKPGTDFNFFPFPTINAQYQGAVTGGADLVVAMRDNSAVRELVKYLATAEAQTIWVKRGGFTSANKLVDPGAYPNPVAKASAEMLTAATTFRFGADDLMPPAVEAAFWKGTLNFINDQNQLESILSEIESVAQQAYIF
jgi:alpha-glucoside transport system substrate-binding protein